MSFIQYIIAGAIGFGVTQLLKNKKKKTVKTINKTNTINTPKDRYTVTSTTFDLSNATMEFNSQDEAQTMYEKIANSKKVEYKDIITYDKNKRELYNKLVKEGNLGKEGYPKLTDSSEIKEVVLLVNNKELYKTEYTK